MKVLTLALTLGLSFSAFAEPVLLNAEVVEYGALAQDSNAPANEKITVKRTAQTPVKVVLKYKMNMVVPTCTQYEIEYTKVEALEQNVCTPVLNGAYDCEIVTHESYEIPKRVCVAKGFVLAQKDFELNIDFKKAIALSPKAVEIFEISLAQETMTSTDMSRDARALDSDSLYTVKVRKNKIYFKAQ